MYSLKNITFKYNTREVIKNLFYNINPGSFLSIVGPNGSGKTTLLKLLDKILLPDSGEIFLNNQSLALLKRKDLAKIVSYLPQSISMQFDLSAFEFVLLGRYPHIKMFEFDKRKDWEIVEDAMKVTDTYDFRLRKIATLSGGEFQRLLIARSLATEPKVLLLDEPTTHLDLNHQISTLKLLKKLNEESNLTIIWISHDINLASLFSKEIILLKNGEILAKGEPKEVITEKNIKTLYNVDVLIERNNGIGRPKIFPAI